MKNVALGGGGIRVASKDISKKSREVGKNKVQMKSRQEVGRGQKIQKLFSHSLYHGLNAKGHAKH